MYAENSLLICISTLTSSRDKCSEALKPTLKEQDILMKVCYDMEAEWEEGGPLITLRQAFLEDLKSVGTNWEEALEVASDQSLWRELAAQCGACGPYPNLEINALL